LSGGGYVLEKREEELWNHGMAVVIDFDKKRGIRREAWRKLGRSLQVRLL
jgi:hypothetical protein